MTRPTSFPSISARRITMSSPSCPSAWLRSAASVKSNGTAGTRVTFNIRGEILQGVHGHEQRPPNFGVKLPAGWCQARRPSRLQHRQIHGVTPTADRSRRASR
jgi:hypothetical protein